MFGLFKKKTEMDKLQEKYEKLLEEARSLASSSRAESYKKYAQAEEVQDEMEALRNKQAEE
jgi:F0F1-type ATP synthase membrane subunit b/b'